MNVTTLKKSAVAGTAVMLSLALTGHAAATPTSETETTETAVSTVHDAQHGAATITGNSIAPTSELSARSATTEPQSGYSIESTAEGDSFSQVVTIDDANSPDTYAFDFDLPEGLTLDEAPDGGAFFRSDDGEAAGRIKAPWAVDAQGKQVDTHFEVQNNRLVQKVDLRPDLQYPVTADPDGVWGWTKCVAAVTAAIAVPAGAVLKLAKFVKAVGNVKEAIQLLTGATSNAEKLEGALAAAGATAAELLGISAIQDNC